MGDDVSGGVNGVDLSDAVDTLIHGGAVTVSDSPTSTGDLEDTPGAISERDPQPEVSSLQSETITHRDRLLRLLAAAREYIVPPSLLTAPPPSVVELSRYAREGRWTAKTDGKLRRLGVWWYGLLALPVTVVCRYVEWIAQRPGRAVVVYLLWKLLILTGPGPWAADHIIRPVLGLLAWVLL